MKNSSWSTVQLVNAGNRGRKSAAQTEHEAERTKLRNLVGVLQAKWAGEDAVDQTRTQQENNDMTSEQKNRLRTLVHKELERTFKDYTHWEEALASILKKHPEFAGGRTEVANEYAALPSPVQFRAEVRREQTAQNCDYDTAFQTVADRYPLLQHPQLANEDLTTSSEAGKKFQEALNRYFEEHTLTLDRKKQSDYDTGFRRVSELHPELVAAMHQPGRTPANLWGRFGTGAGHTPARTRKGSDRPLTTPAQRAGVA